MTTVDQAIWDRSQSPADVGRAADRDGSHWDSRSVGSSNGQVSDRRPDNPFRANLRRLEDVSRASAYCDSRIDRWCEHTGQDPKLCRTALKAGYTVRFKDHRRGREVLLHVVRPEELL